AANIGVHDRVSLTESETGHRCRGVGTDPGQGQQGRVVLRNLATVLFGDGHGTGVQTQRAAWITESAPHAYGLARGLRGQVGGGGPPFRPLARKSTRLNSSH